MTVVGDSLQPSQQVAITCGQGGNRFVYNEYEIACYAMGAVEVVVKQERVFLRR